jgi:hypothetical protein
VFLREIMGSELNSKEEMYLMRREGDLNVSTVVAHQMM